MRNHSTVTTTCTRDCPNTCGLVATVQDGRLTGLTGSHAHPLTQGAACHKTGKYIERVYSDERIIHPMIRRGDEWKRVSWDEALDLVASKITTIVAEDGPQAILYYQGYGERTALKLLNKYFFNLLGGATYLHGSLCGGTGQTSQNMDFGVRISHDPLDHLNSKAMIFWGRNPVSTNISLVRIAKEVQRKGGRIVVIDPLKTKSASLADRHITPAPGRDVYLAMAAAKLIYEAGTEDREFLQTCSVGAAEFKNILDRYTVLELCELAEVDPADAEYLAKTLTSCHPASILLGWGLHRHKNAHHTIRAIDALGAISGNIGVEGGGVSQGFEEYGPYDQKYWGDDLNPPGRTLLMPAIGEEILKASDPPIRMIFSTAANPVCMAPNSTKVAEAFKKTEFIVYSGHFMDDTAELADVFLPATTFLEEDDVMATYGSNYVGPVNKAIEPVGECRSDFHMFSALASRFDFADKFCRDRHEWLHDICKPIREAGCELDRLEKGPFRLPEPMAPYLDRKFPTASGKFQFMTQFSPEEIPAHNPDYPYALLSVAPHGYICSERTLKDHPPLPEVTIHPKEAAAHDLADGDTVLLASVVGEVKAMLRTDLSMRRDCIACERGGWIKAGHGLNRLTTDCPSTVGNGTPYYETRVRISRAR